MEQNNFLFSIIVPVYNTEKYIEESLNSIVKAMDTDCEVIIINDGSTDNSEQVVLDFINKLPEKYKNNFIYTKKENKGLADTKNVGLELSRGKYISVVDSDDYIGEDFYTIARKYINNNSDMLIYDVYVVFEKDRKWNYTSRGKTDSKEEEIVAFLNGAISGSSCNKIIKKELYNDYRFPVGKEYEDTAVTPFLISNAKNITYLPYALYYYRQREKSIVATNTLMSAFYKIASNISEVIISKNLDMENYKYVINEFITDRMLEMLTQDYNENKNQFISNLKDFVNDNKKIIRYIIDSNMLYIIENHYSERQKKLCMQILNDLLQEDYEKICKILKMRKILNKIRSLKR